MCKRQPPGAQFDPASSQPHRRDLTGSAFLASNGCRQRLRGRAGCGGGQPQSLLEATAIFIVEDDAQSGFDHVDCHRSPTLVISAYTKQGADSKFYNTDSTIRTMEELLNVPPHNEYLATARHFNVFGNDAVNDAPYSAIMPSKEVPRRGEPGVSLPKRGQPAIDQTILRGDRRRPGAKRDSLALDQGAKHPDPQDARRALARARRRLVLSWKVTRDGNQGQPSVKLPLEWRFETKGFSVAISTNRGAAITTKTTTTMRTEIISTMVSPRDP